MGLLQRWLDEPDESIARFAKAFYALTFLFLALLGYQLVRLALRWEEPLVAADVLGPLVNLALVSTTYSLALDGRRSHRMRTQPRDPVR